MTKKKRIDEEQFVQDCLALNEKIAQGAMRLTPDYLEAGAWQEAPRPQ